MRTAATLAALLFGCSGTLAAEAPFVANHGQFPAHVRYAAPGHPLMPWVSDGALWFIAGNVAGKSRVAVRLSFAAPYSRPRIAAAGAPGPALSFYRGAQPAHWLERLDTHYRLRFVLAGSGGEVSLRADQRGIHFSSTGAQGIASAVRLDGAPLEVDATGQLHLVINGTRLPLPITADKGAVLAIEGRDRYGRPVSRVPPTRDEAADAALRQSDGSIAYASLMGSGLADEAEAVHHHAGDVFIGGHTQGFTFPANPGVLAPSRQHVVNAFVARISPTDPANGFVTLFQGSDQLDGEEFVFALKVNGAGETLFAGNTNSADFPVTPGAYDTRYGGAIDAFVGKLNGNGTLAWATYFGSSEFDSAYALDIDVNGNVYIAGGSWSTDLPTTADAFAGEAQGERDAFVAVLDATGSNLRYCSYLGGSSQEQAEALAVDSAGRIHLTGWTRSSDFGAGINHRRSQWRGAAASPFDAFAARIDPSALSIDYAVTVGGTDEDRGDTIALDGAGRAIISGLTASGDFPVSANAVDASYGGGTCSFAPCPDAFLAVLAGDGQNLVYSSYYGGNSWDAGRAVAVDADGSILLAGVTQSADLPVAGATSDAHLDGVSDAFVARFDIASPALLLSTYLGGSSEDAANALSTDDVGRVYLAGHTRSADFPTTPGAFATDLAGDYDAFAVVLDEAPADTDGDGIADSVDNCTMAFNPQQIDSNADGFGNLCDGDLNGDCAINFLDLAAMKAVFFSADEDADLNTDGSVNFLDLAVMKGAFFLAPGPSAMASCSR